MIKRLNRFIYFLINDTRGHYLLIGLFALAAHGLLLLNDGVYWDGWLIYVGKLKNRWDLISSIYADRGGLPIYTAFHWILYQFPYFVFGYKLVAYLFILFSTFFVYRIATLLSGSAQIGLFIALIALTYPANQAVVELIVIPYLLSYFLFWLGCLLLVLDFTKQRKPAYWFHLGAVISLLLSFRMYSLLVYFYGFLFLLLLVWWSRNRGVPFFETIQTYVRSYWLYFLLPIIFWLGNFWLFPPSGPYVNSDAFILDASIVPLIQNYFTYGLFGQLIASLSKLFNPFILPIVIVVSLTVTLYFKADKTMLSWLESKTAAWVLALSGVLFFVAGFAPYVAVGRSTLLQGWSTRNAILIAVPIAMMLLGLVLALSQLVKGIDRNKSARIAVFILSALVVLFTVETIKFYFNWQLRAIKDNSVIANIARQAYLLEDTSVFIVYDNFLVGGDTRYRPHEYYGMFAKAIPESDKIGFAVNGDEVDNELLEIWYPNLDFNGCQTKMRIRVGSVDLNPGNFFRYFYYRFLDPDELDAFLYAVTDLKFVPFTSDLATNCVR